MMECSKASRGERAVATFRRGLGAGFRELAWRAVAGAVLAAAAGSAVAGSPAGKAAAEGAASAASPTHAGKASAPTATAAATGTERGGTPAPLIAAMMASTAGIEAAAAAAKKPLVSDAVPPSPWSAESCDRWRREGFMNCLRQLDANPRLLLSQSVTWVDDEQVDRAKRGQRLLELRLEPSQAREINAWCTDRATVWAQASSKACH